MKAGDVMTTKVVAVGPNTPGRSIALTLFKHGISAVPVVDDNGAPIGMVSEGDLVPRDEREREARRDWWLRALAEGEDLSPEFLRHLQAKDRLAREVMHAPIVTATEDTDLVEIAELLSTKRIKRVPIVRDGRMVGIVSRADLVRAVATPHAREPEPKPESEILVASDQLQALGQRKPVPSSVRPKSIDEDTVSAASFRGLVAHFEEDEAVRRQEAHRLLVEKHKEEARHLLATQLTEEAWHRMLHDARLAAHRGEKEHMILRFPHELCTDQGRAINAPDPSWPETLRGVAAQVFMRWKNELRSQGFALHARVMEFPDGLPGDIGLFLAWGK
ncbi:MAG: CBS domain-containing protein [Hyphomicrobiales bacterium]|nr:CBS domain-containing protein [Hyphomicrobiales bacterium]